MFKPIPNIEGYLIDLHGEVISTPKKLWNGHKYWMSKERKIKTYIGKNGYHTLGIVIKGKGKKVYLHRLLAQAFIENKEDKPCINHKDGVKTNNSINNLEWCTYTENNRHAWKNNLIHGIKRYGEENNSSKITNQTVLQIRKSSGRLKDLAMLFGLSISQISNIKNYKSWIHI